jgi:hypothetical protein
VHTLHPVYSDQDGAAKTVHYKPIRLHYKLTTVDPVYSERIGATKSVHLRQVFTINVFNLTIN